MIRLSLALAALLFATPALARNAISGEVKDRNGAPLDRVIITLKPGNVGDIGDDQRYFCRVARRLRRFRQRDHVGAAPGDQHPDALAGRRGAHSESLPR